MIEETVNPENIQKPHKKARVFIWKNPVFIREMRRILRMPQARASLTISMIVMASISLLIYIVIVSSNVVNPDPDIRRTLGRILFLSISFVQFIGVSFISPFILANAISTERERSTFDLIRVTPIPMGAVLRGKFAAGLMYVLLFLIMGIPFLSAAYIFGGLNLSELLMHSFVLLATTGFACSLSIWASSKFNSNTAAVFSILVVCTIYFGIPFLAAALFLISPLTVEAGLLNTMIIGISRLPPDFESIVFYLLWLVISLNPFLSLFLSYEVLSGAGLLFWYTLKPVSTFSVSIIAPWISYSLIYSLLTLFLVPFTRKNVLRRS